MCLVVIALRTAPRFPLVIAANRDELHARRTEPARWWPDRPSVFAGRDLVAGGTWLGVSRTGRLAAVTNVRDGPPRSGPASRGNLVTGFLLSDSRPEGYAEQVAGHAQDYAAFNLLLVADDDVRYASNRAPPAALGPGVHALSHAVLGERWPKIASAEAATAAALTRPAPTEALFEMLAERGPMMGPTAYQSAHFIEGPIYGTRCSTVVLVDHSGLVTFVERSFSANGTLHDEVSETFALSPD
jgi:uncharacterized protein with NRDE domain